MTQNPNNQIYSSRVMNAPIKDVYQAFANPVRLAKWWGPEGFTNTFHEFDLRAGGKWVLTMHGPDKGNYQNAAVFETVEPEKLVSWSRTSKPLFDMEVGFEEITPESTRISFRMIFETEEECAKIKSFAGPKNEENFDRLAQELLSAG